MATEASTPTKGAAVNEAEFVIDLPAPDGWQKKFAPRGVGTPKRSEITFISPTGEEVTNKRQLDQYLRAHPGGPRSSEFDWGTGDSPRRSSRLTAKAKAAKTPEGEKPAKKGRPSSGKRGKRGKKDTEDAKKEAPNATDDAKESADLDINTAEGDSENIKEDVGAEVQEEGEKVSVENIDAEGSKSEGKEPEASVEIPAAEESVTENGEPPKEARHPVTCDQPRVSPPEDS